MTIDIETLQLHDVGIFNKIKPYLICGYSKLTGSFHEQLEFTSDILGEESINYHDITMDMIDHAIQTMFYNFLLRLISIKDIKYVYAHNFAKFDGPLLLKYIITFSTWDYAVDTIGSMKVEPLVFNGKLISVKLIINDKSKNKRTIIFKDSYLLMNYSLRQLCDTFNINNKKMYFPIHFFIEDAVRTLDYNGPLPDYSYWGNMPLHTYNELQENFLNKNWNFMFEAIKYCDVDCVSLFQILTKFNNLIFDSFKINIHEVLTLPSLAMKIFRTHYMPADTIYQILGKVEKDIRESYTGGAVDVYIPHNKVDVTDKYSDTIPLNYFDVNSLYPYVMCSMNVPTGIPTAFEGNILDINPEAYGFFYCKIDTPEKLDHPILQRKIKTKDGMRTIAGLGSWEGWVYSEEMFTCLKFGYKFEVIRGYLFTPAKIFSDYVAYMYNLRTKHPKGSPLELTAKMLMNSLYGKFGMKAEQTELTVVRTDHDRDLRDILTPYLEDKSLHIIDDVIQISDDTQVIVKKNVPQYKEDSELVHGLDVSIPIASAITSGGRIFMSRFKNNPEITLYYSDTDSIIIDKELNPSIVGSELGQLKLENRIDKFVCLAPKFYYIENMEGKKIIKVKGLNMTNNNLISNYKKLLDLLIVDTSLELTQDKWYKSMFTGEISIKSMLHHLTQSCTKRKQSFVINEEGQQIWDRTEAYNYDEFLSEKSKE